MPPGIDDTVAVLSTRQWVTPQVEARSPDRPGPGGEDLAMGEDSLTTPLTAGEGDLSEVDITSQHNSVISATPDSTIGPGSRLRCETPGGSSSLHLGRP
jgi:hypothetical protein